MNTKPLVRFYAPELWGEVDRFAKFYSGSLVLPEVTKRAVSGVVNHFEKAMTFKALSERLKPNLLIDRGELEKNGFTSAQNSRELSAVIEEVFTELYSSVDCSRAVIFELNKKCRGLPNSTRKMFQKVSRGEVNDEFPEPLRNAIQNADWFFDLMAIRDELTHLSIGNCHLDTETGAVSYMHQGIKRENQTLIVPDIFAEVDRFFNGVNAFLGQVFHYFNSILKDEPTFQMCGIFYGRAYARLVSPYEARDFNGGKCNSFQWFDTQDEYRCPFAESCGAYAAAKG